MFRLVLGVLLCALASLGLAAFDLQFVKKYNPTALGLSSFTHVVRDGSGGFVAAGTAGLDLLIVRFDQYGSITHTRVWDTPLVREDLIEGLFRTSTGEISVVVKTPSIPSYLVRFDENLVPRWFVSLPNGCRATTNADGVSCYVVAENATTLKAQIVTSAGTLSGSVNVSGESFYTVEPCNSTTNPGFLIGGHRANQAFVSRITNSAGGIYNTLGAASPSGTNRVTEIAADSSGVVTGVGITSDGSAGRITLFRVTSGGTLTSFQLAQVNNPIIRSVQNVSSTVARALLSLDGVSQIREFNRTTFALIRTYERPNILGFAPITDSAQIITASESGEMARFSTSGGNPAVSTTHPTFAASPLDADSAVTVGQSLQGEASVAWYRNNILFETSFRFPGPIERALVDSDLGPSGVLAQIMESEDSPGGSRMSTTVVAYRANGTVAFAKGLFAGSDVSAGRVLVMADGSVLATGYIRGATAVVLASTLYSPTGAIVFAKTYALPSGLVTLSDLKFVSGAGYFGIGDRNNSAVLIRIGSNGLLFWERVIDTNISSLGNMVVTPANDLAIMIRRSAGVDIGIVDAGSGDVLVSTPLDAATSWTVTRLCATPDGHLVAMISDQLPNITLMRKLNSVSLAQIAAYNDLHYTASVDVGANGRVGLLQSDGSVARVKTFGDGFTAPVSTNLEPTVDQIRDIAVGPTGLTYVLGNELDGSAINTYAAKYLQNGVRSAVRRLSGTGREIFAPTGAVWITGDTPTRAKGINPYAAKYTP